MDTMKPKRKNQLIPTKRNLLWFSYRPQRFEFIAYYPLNKCAALLERQRPPRWGIFLTAPYITSVRVRATGKNDTRMFSINMLAGNNMVAYARGELCYWDAGKTLVTGEVGIAKVTRIYFWIFTLVAAALAATGLTAGWYVDVRGLLIIGGFLLLWCFILYSLWSRTANAQQRLLQTLERVLELPLPS